MYVLFHCISDDVVAYVNKLTGHFGLHVITTIHLGLGKLL